jgi:uncharacterized protein (DUF697 family)
MERAQAIIKNYSLWAAGAGLIPLPVADLVVVMKLQMSMIDELAVLYYDRSPKARGFLHHSGKTFVASLSGASAARLTATLAKSLVKTIPVVGDALGAVTMAPLAGATTYALGQAVLAELEHPHSNSDDSDTIDPERLRQTMKDYLQEGFARMAFWRERKSELDPMDELEHLAWLFEQNIIPRDDFEHAKTRLLAKL